jgi:hypothetical protein
MKRTIIVYGLISGAISAALMVVTMLVSDRIGFDRGYIIGYSAMVVSFLPIYFGMASYRDKIGGGQIKYGRALSIGLLVTVISSICYVIAWVIVYHTMFPDFLEKYSAHMIAKMKEKGSSQAEINKQMAEMQQYSEMYKNPVMMCLLTFMEPLPVGIIVSIISAFIVRMKKKTSGI